MFGLKRMDRRDMKDSLRKMLPIPADRSGGNDEFYEHLMNMTLGYGKRISKMFFAVGMLCGSVGMLALIYLFEYLMK